MEKLKQHRDDVMSPFNYSSVLPWQLEGLVEAASSGLLRFGITGIPDTNRYVMSWGCTYLVSDKTGSSKTLMGSLSSMAGP